MRNKIHTNIIVLLALSLFSCNNDVNVSENFSRVIDKITITVIRADSNTPLMNATVELLGNEEAYARGFTNNDGVVIFNQVQANYANMHCIIVGEAGGHVYSWYSYEQGYPDGFNFYNEKNKTFKINPFF